MVNRPSYWLLNIIHINSIKHSNVSIWIWKFLIRKAHKAWCSTIFYYSNAHIWLNDSCSRNQFILKCIVLGKVTNKTPTAAKPTEQVVKKLRPPVAKKPPLKADVTAFKSNIASAAVELVTSHNQKKITEDTATQRTTFSTERKHVSTIDLCLNFKQCLMLKVQGTCVLYSHGWSETRRLNVGSCV